MTGAFITVLHPAAETAVKKDKLAPRLASLQGSTVGLIDNHKRNADIYLDELARRLKREYGVAEIMTYRKASQSVPTPQNVMDDLCARCDAIIHAVAD
jgi:hypothetical protein